MTVMAWGISSVFAMLVVSEFFIPVYMRGAMSTTPDFLQERYDAGTKRLVSFIFLVSYLVNLLPIVLYSGAVALNGLFHFSDRWGIGYLQTICVLVWGMGILGGLYSIIGGLKAIVVSDLLLAVGMFAAGLMLTYFGLRQLGGGSLQHGIDTIISNKTAHLNAIGTTGDAVPFGTIFTGMLIINLFYWGTEQVIVQQALAGRSLADTQKGISLACVGKLIGPLLFNVPGIIAVHMYAHMENTAEVFPRLVSDVSPPVIVGFVAAILLGAVLTSFAPGLNSASTLFILNIYKPYKEKKGEVVTAVRSVRIARRFELCACLLAVSIAPLIVFAQGGFYTYMQKVSGTFSVPIFTIMFVGFVTKRVPPIAAKIGLLFCGSGYMLTQVVWDTGLHFLHVLAILFVLTTGIMLVIGKFYPMKEAYRPLIRNKVDLRPWKNRHWATAALLILMILIYWVFSPLGLVRS
jgi:SSS family solute:Na+ symporter